MKVLALKLDESGNLINAITNDTILPRNALFGDGNWKTVDGALQCISDSTVTKSSTPFNVANFYDYDKIELYFSMYLPSSMEYNKKYCFISVDINPDEEDSGFMLYKPSTKDYIALYHQDTRVWTQSDFSYIKGIISVKKTSDTEVTEYIKLLDNDNNILYESTYTTSTFNNNFYFTVGTDSYYSGTYYYQNGTIFYPDVSDLLTSPKIAYYQLLDNPANNLKGNWEITEDGYLSVTGMTNSSIAMFSQLGALQDFTLEWTSKQLGGSIRSNLCPMLRYTPEDLGIEGGGSNWAFIGYLCSYSQDPIGTFLLRYEGGDTVKEHPETEASIAVNSIHTFKLVRSGSTLTLYEDDVLITTTTKLPSKPLYLGWYLWYGGTSNANYQTNFILQDYKLEAEIYNDSKKYLDTEGLVKVWEQIGKKYYSKEEINTKLSNAGISSSTSIINMDNYVDMTDTFNGLLDGSIIGGYWVAVWEPPYDGWLSLNIDNGSRIIIEYFLTDTTFIRLFDITSSQTAFTAPVQKNKRYRITSSSSSFTQVMFIPNI